MRQLAMKQIDNLGRQLRVIRQQLEVETTNIEDAFVERHSDFDNWLVNELGSYDTSID